MVRRYDAEGLRCEIEENENKTVLMGKQMSLKWIEANISKMIRSTDEATSKAEKVLQDFMRNNGTYKKELFRAKKDGSFYRKTI